MFQLSKRSQSEMKIFRAGIVFSLTALVLLNPAPLGRACGPDFTRPIFVFRESPDFPFAEFTKGKIGIVRPTFGRKTLVIAYRYLNGGSFNSAEQTALVEALEGAAPDDLSTAAVKGWINARKEVFKQERKLPQIYTERQYTGYDFFPNCSQNAFEVATQTLKDRTASYGADNENVKAWLAAQDTVFQNCAGGARAPADLGAESPAWLRRDRAYQIAAAQFYSLHFDDARMRFQLIAGDSDSPWQKTAEYLIGRTFVRQASLASSETERHELYEQAEKYLQLLSSGGGQFAGAAKKLLALIQYRLHPDERVVELGRLLANGGNEDLRQDLIDYVWLLDRLEAQIIKAEEDRKTPQPSEKKSIPWSPYGKEEGEKLQRVEAGELIQIWFYLKKEDGTPDYSHSVRMYFPFDATSSDVFKAFEEKLARPLTDTERKEIKESYESALSRRQYLISPNRQLDSKGLSQYEGCSYRCARLAISQIPDSLRADDLSDWIFALQSQDQGAYDHALSRWRETRSHAWLLVAMMKAEKSSPQIASLMRAAERTSRDTPEFPTIAYQLIRLRMELGRKDEARKLLDEVISWQSENLPISAQNQFLEQRMELAQTLDEFLKPALRKPAAFSRYGTPGRISDLLDEEKSAWNPNYTTQTKEEFERDAEALYKDQLAWDDRVAFDERTADMLNRHFPLQTLAQAARDPALPEYLQRSMVLAVWTRAVLLGNDQVALKIAPEVPQVAPDIEPFFTTYLKAENPEDRRHAALYVLLKFPNLSPFVPGGFSLFQTAEQMDYFFETAWWCEPSDTKYNGEGQQVAKIIDKPPFLTPKELETAQREHNALIAIGDGKRYLGKQVLEWAATAPADPRLPEALFIAARANEPYKYSCSGSWESDEETEQKAEKILRQNYPQNPWTAKLSPPRE
jgi:hypothetical protein